MKKVIALFIAATMIFCFAACGKKYAPSGRTLFTFDGEKVTEEEFIFSYRNIITSFVLKPRLGSSRILDLTGLKPWRIYAANTPCRRWATPPW